MKVPRRRCNGPGLGRTGLESDMPQTTCSVDECDRKVLAKGFCNAHYIRSTRGVPLTAKPIRGSVVSDTCIVDECGRKSLTRGWCNTHYNRWLATGVASGDIPPRVPNAGLPCSIESCDRPAALRLYCSAHYQQWRLHGEVEDAPVRGGWKTGSGDDVGYSAVHWRLSKELGPASDRSCADCGMQAADWSYDHLDRDERREGGLPYSVKASHYAPRCRPCHKTFDMSPAR